MIFLPKIKLFVGCVLFLIFTMEICFASADSTSRKLQASASVSINSNGIASIPAFSLDKPAIIASLSLIKGRFSYDPVLAYGLNMKPWFVDNWLHYKVISKPLFILRAGWNFSTFFTQSKMEGQTILRGERYFAGEIAGFYKLNPGAGNSNRTMYSKSFYCKHLHNVAAPLDRTNPISPRHRAYPNEHSSPNSPCHPDPGQRHDSRPILAEASR